jgi:hypothetical protein
VSRQSAARRGRSWDQEVTQGPRLGGDGEWVHVYRFIDRDADVYLEIVADSHGDVIRRIEQPLTEHQGRGSARLTAQRNR